MNSNEPIFPRPDVLNDLPYGKFVLANLAARRAKQIRDGAPPLVRIDSNHPLSIALAEIAAGKIKPILGAQSEVSSEIDEFASLETTIETEGILLPGIDDLGLAASLGFDELEDPDMDDLEEHDEEVASITDLLVDEEIVTEDATDDADISLDDLASQEEGEDDEAADLGDA